MIASHNEGIYPTFFPHSSILIIFLVSVYLKKFYGGGAELCGTTYFAGTPKVPLAWMFPVGDGPDNS